MGEFHNWELLRDTWTIVKPSVMPVVWEWVGDWRAYFGVPVCGFIYGLVTGLRDREKLGVVKIIGKTILDATAACVLFFALTCIGSLAMACFKFWYPTMSVRALAGPGLPPPAPHPVGKPSDTLPHRTLELANDLYDWSLEQEGSINSWKTQAMAQAMIDAMHKNSTGQSQFQQRLSASSQEAAQRFITYYWPQVTALQDQLRATGVDTQPISHAEASNDPAREIAIALSILADRIGKHGPFHREITPLQMKMLSQQLDLRNLEISAYLLDANSRRVAETLRQGFGAIKGVSVNLKLYPLEKQITDRHGIWLIYPSADWTTELNGFIPSFDECQLENKWEVKTMKQPPSILKIEVWPETPNWQPVAGPNLMQP